MSDRTMSNLGTLNQSACWETTQLLYLSFNFNFNFPLFSSFNFGTILVLINFNLFNFVYFVL